MQGRVFESWWQPVVDPAMVLLVRPARRASPVKRGPCGWKQPCGAQMYRASNHQKVTGWFVAVSRMFKHFHLMISRLSLDMSWLIFHLKGVFDLLPTINVTPKRLNAVLAFFPRGTWQSDFKPSNGIDWSFGVWAASKSKRPNGSRSNSPFSSPAGGFQTFFYVHPYGDDHFLTTKLSWLLLSGRFLWMGWNGPSRTPIYFFPASFRGPRAFWDRCSLWQWKVSTWRSLKFCG